MLDTPFGFQVNGGADVQRGLKQLQGEADAARAAGDTEGEKKALQKLKEAQDDASQLAGLAPASKPASLAGETAGVLNVIFGRSGTSDLVLDENKAQTSALRDIHRTLELEPRHFGALCGLAEIFSSRGERDDAVFVFQAALRVNPHLDDARTSLEQLLAEGADPTH